MELPRTVLQRLQEHPEFQDEPEADVRRNLQSAIQSLAKIYADAEVDSPVQPAHLLWETIDKFALHVISTAGTLPEQMFERAMQDLVMSEKQYDDLSPEQQNAAYAVNEHLLVLLTTSDRTRFQETLAFITKFRVLPRTVLQRLQEHPEFQDEPEADVRRNLQSAIQSLAKIYADAEVDSPVQPAHLLWETIDKFALHVISTAGTLPEQMFERAMQDLVMSEKQYDDLSPEQQNAAYAVNEHLLVLLTTSDRTRFQETLAFITDEDNDREFTLDMLDRLCRPSSLRPQEDLTDRILHRVWTKLTRTYNGAFITKRMRRLDVISQGLKS